MFFSKKNEGALFAPCTGECIPTERIPDEAFSKGLLGKGFGVLPAEGWICSPVNGTVETIAETKHAYTLLTEDGLDILIHIGVDTVEMKGEGFRSLVTAGCRVRAGERLAKVQLELIREHRLSDAVSVLVTNPERLRTVDVRYGNCVGGQDILMRYQTVRKG